MNRKKFNYILLIAYILVAASILTLLAMDNLENPKDTKKHNNQLYKHNADIKKAYEKSSNTKPKKIEKDKRTTTNKIN